MPFFPTAARLRTLADVDQSTAPGDGESPAWSAAADRFAWAAGGGKPPATIVVAAANSIDKASADFVCTGADDQATWNDAFIALNNVFGGLILALEGDYFFTDQAWTRGPDTAVRGMGAGSRFHADASNMRIFSSFFDRATWQNFALVGNFGTNVGGLWVEGSRTLISGLYVEGTTAAGIRLFTGDGQLVIHTHVRGEGVGIHSASPSSLIQGVRVTNVFGTGIHLDEASTVTGCRVQSCSTGVEIAAGVTGAAVAGNDLRGNTTPITDNGTGTLLAWPAHATFGDNFT